MFLTAVQMQCSQNVHDTFTCSINNNLNHTESDKCEEYILKFRRSCSKLPATMIEISERMLITIYCEIKFNILSVLIYAAG